MPDSTPDRVLPLFVVGSPRSGTTFVGELLNSHPCVYISNELRAIDFFRAVLDGPGLDRALLFHGQLRPEFLQHFRGAMASSLESFYLERALAKRTASKDIASASSNESAGAALSDSLPPRTTDLVWGDKTPGYADPVLSPGCMRLLTELVPNARIVHVVRRARGVIASLVAKGWESPLSAAHLWARITREARSWGTRLGTERFLELSHDDLCADPDHAAARLFGFLGLDLAPPVREFLRVQKTNPTAIAEPETPLTRLGTPGAEAVLAPNLDAALTTLVGPPGATIEESLERIAEAHAARVQAVGAHPRQTPAPPDSGRSSDGMPSDGLPAAPSSILAPESAAKLFRFPADIATIRGRLEIDITSFACLIDGQPIEGEPAARVTPGCLVQVALGFCSPLSIGEASLRFRVLDKDGVSVFYADSKESGRGPVHIAMGWPDVHFALRWPRLGAGVYWLCMGIFHAFGFRAQPRERWLDRFLGVREFSA